MLPRRNINSRATKDLNELSLEEQRASNAMQKDLKTLKSIQLFMSGVLAT